MAHGGLRIDTRGPLIPVVFLSARAEEYDKIVALEIGGDDYLTKPFSMKELFARVEVCLRRIRLYTGAARADGTREPIVIGGIRMDADGWTCECRGQDVVLTISEFRILGKPAGNPGIVMSRDVLAEAAFPDDNYNLGRSIDVHVHRIRRKLQDIDPGFDSLETVHRLGYRWKT